MECKAALWWIWGFIYSQYFKLSELKKDIFSKVNVNLWKIWWKLEHALAPSKPHNPKAGTLQLGKCASLTSLLSNEMRSSKICQTVKFIFFFIFNWQINCKTHFYNRPHWNCLIGLKIQEVQGLQNNRKKRNYLFCLAIPGTVKNQYLQVPTNFPWSHHIQQSFKSNSIIMVSLLVVYYGSFKFACIVIIIQPFGKDFGSWC